jgi:hypothetical protein
MEPQPQQTNKVAVPARWRFSLLTFFGKDIESELARQDMKQGLHHNNKNQ